jgi:hypothetical protein
MRGSFEQRKNLIAEAMRRYTKRRPLPTYQKVVFWIIILGALFLVLNVVLSR